MLELMSQSLEQEEIGDYAFKYELFCRWLHDLYNQYFILYM